MSAEVGFNKYEEVKTVPVVDLVFTSSKKSLIDRVSDAPLQFTRNTIGTYVDENGIIQTAAAGEPRYTYDPETGEELGLLVEESRTNLLRYTNDIGNAPNPYWIQNSVAVGVNAIPNAALSPDGQMNATFVQENLENTSHYIWHPSSHIPADKTNTIFTYSAYIKPNGRTNIIFYNNIGATITRFDLDNPSANVEILPNGWYRLNCQYTSDSSNPQNNSFFIGMEDAEYTNLVYGSKPYQGDGTSGFYVWGAQCEEGSFATSYIPTTTLTITRDPDLVTLTNTNIYDNEKFDIINQPFGSAVGSNELTLLPTDKPIERVTIFSPNTTQERINTFADKEDEFWRWRVTGTSFGLNQFGTDGQVTVDWDDGTVETLTTSDHTFTDGKTYHEIGFRLDSGTRFNPYVASNATYASNVIAIGPAPSSMILDAYNTFFGCGALKSFDSTINATGSTSVFQSWYNCYNLANFPLIDTSGVTDFRNAWISCISLTSFPLIDTSSGTSFSYTWRSCASLTTFPLIDTSSGTNFVNTWQGCSSLTTFPEIDTSSGTNFSSTWQSCTSLTTFPEIDTSSGITFDSTWRGCASLTSFPEINTSSGTWFAGTWISCASLTSFPLINITAGTYFNAAWRSCTSLADFPANFFDSWVGTPLSNCFVQTWTTCSSLTSTSVENIYNSLSVSPSSSTPPASGTNIDVSYNASTGTPDITVSAIDLTAKGWTPTLGGIAQTNPYSFASLDLDFATNKTLNDNISSSNLITFTRGSTGTYVDSNGVIQTAAIDAPRFDHDPDTLESLGLLVEEERTNYVKYSNDIYHNGGIEANTWNIVDITTSSLSSFYGVPGVGTLTPSASIAPDNTLTASYFRAVGVNYLRSPVVTFGNNGQPLSSVVVNLNTGTITSSNTSASPASIVPAGNGWYRISWNGRSSYIGSFSTCSIYAKAGETGVLTLSFYPLFGGMCMVLQTGGTAEQGVYVWGAQIEPGSFPTSYIPTPATFTSRNSTATYYDSNGVIQTAAIDVARNDAYLPDENGVFRPAGLLIEGSETNYISSSANPLRCQRYQVFTNASNLTTGPITIVGGGTLTAYVTDVQPIDGSNCYIFVGSITGVPSNPATFTQGGNTYNGSANRFLVGFDVYNNVGDNSNFPVLSNVLAPDGVSYAYEQTGQIKMYQLSPWNTNPSVFSVFVKAKTATSISISNEYDFTSYNTFNFTTGTWDSITSSTEAVFVQKLPNGWFRIGVLDTRTRGFYNRILSSGSYYCWGFQYSSSSYMSSYIPTAGSTVTRAADVSTSATVTRAADEASITGSNFTSFWNSEKEGTLFFEHDLNPETQTGNPTNSMIIAFSTSLTTYNGPTLGLWGSGDSRYFPTDYSNGTYNTDGWPTRTDLLANLGITLANPGKDRYAVGYKVGTGLSNLAINGTLLGARDTSADYIPTGLYFGGSHNQRISRLTYWPKRLTDTSLQYLTQ